VGFTTLEETSVEQQQNEARVAHDGTYIEIPEYSVIEYDALQLPAQYHNVIISRFLRSYRFGNDLIKMIDREHYFFKYEQFVKKLINYPGIKIRLAVLSDEPDNVLGWCIYKDVCLIYMHVQELMRNNGIAISMMPKEIEDYSHLTNSVIKILARNKYNYLKFKPFLNPFE
jgi:hypothetical protein